MKRTIAVGFGLILCASCGGGGGSSSTPDPVVDPDPGPDPIVIAAPTFPPNFSVTQCTGLDFIDLISAETTLGTAESDFGPENVIDNDLDPSSRWESPDNPAEITIDLGYRHLVQEVGTAWFQGDESVSTFNVSISEDGLTYSSLLTDQQSGGITNNFERFEVASTVARFVRITGTNNTISTGTALVEAAVFGCPLDVSIAPIQTQSVDLSQYNLDPSAPPGDNFNLLTWSLDTPREDPSDGLATRTSERNLDNGFVDIDHFYTGPEGGMVFRSTIFGVATSSGTRFNRSELREQLRLGDTSISTTGLTRNNWVLGYQPDISTAVGGRNGVLRATLRVDQTTTTGTQQHMGRVIIGQIHASDDEPMRIYFKKFPDNDRGYIYFAHELNINRPDLWFTVVGPENDDNDDEPIFTQNPENGIELGEIFSYEIDQQGPRIDVTIRRGDQNGPIIGHNYVNMIELGSDYDLVNEWNYFRAGAYTQNDSGEDGDANGVGSDFDEITFFEVINTHDPE